MYQAYWGLSDSPFRGQAAPRPFHQAPTQEEALARLHFLVEERRSLGLLLGTPGVGKSHLLEVFAQQLGHIQRQTATLHLIGAGLHEFLWDLAAQLGIDVHPDASPFKLIRSVEDHLAANRYQQIATILLLDDADEARPEVIAEILRLIQLDTTSAGSLTMVLSAEPRRCYHLDLRLLELAELRVEVEAWAQEDTGAFLKSALAAAGRTSPVFSESAVARLHELTAGIPRRIKQLADLALLAGAGAGLSQIDAATVASVYQELGVLSAREPLALARRS